MNYSVYCNRVVLQWWCVMMQLWPYLVKRAIGLMILSATTYVGGCAFCINSVDVTRVASKLGSHMTEN